MAIHFDASRMEEVAENHERWWKGELDRPLIYASIFDAYEASHKDVAPTLTQANCTDFSWTPEQIIDAYDSALSKREFIGDGYPQISLDPFGPGVVAAFCGAKLDNSSGNVWFFPADDRELSDLHVKYDPENIWSRRIKDIYRAGLERWNGSVIMGMPDLGGNMDILAAMYGTEKLLFAILEEPEEVQRVLREIQTAFYDAYADFEEVLKPQKYYSDWTSLLSKVPSYTLQCDFSYMISPDMFEEFAMPCLLEDTQRLAHTMYHMDGIGELKHQDRILSLKDLNAVQWVYGAGQPGPMHWLDVYRKIINAGKQIHLMASAGEFFEVVKELHGSPYCSMGFGPKDRDLAMQVLSAR